MATVTVEELLAEMKEELKLKLIEGKAGLKKKITDPDINRPGLALTGHFKYFAHRRIQVLGKREILYLNELSVKTREERIKKFYAYPKIPCFIISRAIKVLPELKAFSHQAGVPLLRTSMATALFISRLTIYLKSKLAREISLHGTLLDVYAVGILILGESGIGKSEIALELVKRGHRLIADDVVMVRRVVENVLVGRCAKLIKYCMEIRGLGIIDVKELFGAGAIKNEEKIELVIKLEEWKEGKDYDRLGLEESTYTILEVKVPQITIPVKPGRNLAVIIEVAAMNKRLRRMGYHPAKEIEERLQKDLNKRRNGTSRSKNS